MAASPGIQHPQFRRPGRAGRGWTTAALALAVALAWLPASAAPEDSVEPYSARYAVYRNGKLQARAEFLLQKEGGSWIMKSESIGTHGMARLMKFRDYEFVEGHFEGGGFQPLRYVHELKWLGPNQDWSADFDWEKGRVTVTDNGETRTFDLVEGAVDPMSLQLELRRQLARPEPRLEFMLVEDDELELQRFRTLPAERLETSLGCLHTQPVEKVREGSTRFTRFWHASDLRYIPVRMEHGKTDGDQMELRITELVLGGEPVDPKPGCAAAQGAAASKRGAEQRTTQPDDQGIRP